MGVLTLRVFTLLIALTGCGRIGFGVGTDPDAAGSDDSSSPDADTGPTVWGDFTDPAAWSAFDMTTLGPGASGYTGAVFDGRYTYYVPSYNGALHGLVARNDTQRPFADAASWALFDTSTVNPAARGYEGGAFDGRYVYFVPHQNPASYDGVVARYDTQQSFATGAAWQTFDTQTLAPFARGFYGAQFDGRYLYFIPYFSTILARFDTQASFTSAAAWTTFDVSTVSASAPASIGAVFDGRYLYLAPFSTAAAFSGEVLRYDTQGALTDTTAWKVFDTTTLMPEARGYCGAAFDGRYVYLVPFVSAQGVASGLVTRFDTQATFTTPASWEIFDLTTVDARAKSLFGATFDGRFVTFAPYGGSVAARYDTQATFGSAAAWRVFDVKTVDARLGSYYGATFDGSAMYFVPHGGSTVAKFVAKTPPSMPVLPAFFGSFF